MIMQVKSRALALGACLAALVLTACETRDQAESAPVTAPADQPSAAAEPTDDPSGDSTNDPTAEPPVEEDAPPVISEPARPSSRPPQPPPVQVLPDLSREPIDLEEVLVVGARDGETLGEYRARADRAFDRLDINRDRRLDQEEILAGVRPGRFATALERADIDLDQAVSRQEFDDLVTRAFQHLDADGNGILTEAELEAGDLFD